MTLTEKMIITLSYFISLFFFVVFFMGCFSYVNATATEQSAQDSIVQFPAEGILPQVTPETTIPQLPQNTNPVMPKVAHATFWPTTLYLGIDCAKTGYGWYQKIGNSWEISSSTDFSFLLWDMDYGKGSIQRDGGNHGSVAYSAGNYFKIGLSCNFLTPTSDHNQFFLGIRYARSWFNFRLQGRNLPCNHRPYSDEGVEQEKTRKECKACLSSRKDWGDTAIADWWEIVAGSKVRLVGILSIGCTLRYKFLKRTVTKNTTAEPFDIPGFGFGEYDDAFGCSLYILVRIPLQNGNRAAANATAEKTTLS